jgi:UDP-N-acetylglucosamine--N-acetylmuramyl-(pentapeptide) pyrophosphoryl-undecaprenol N-acetylglucosamine transferase
VPAAGLPLERISITGLRGRGILGWLMAPLRVFKAMLQARRIFRRQRPRCVLSMGGYVAGPGGLMARLMGIPLLIHEQNAIPGLTNRLLRPLAKRVFGGFPNGLPGAVHSGNPVRSEILRLPPPSERFAARSGPLKLLVVGGSQGSAALGQIVPKALALIPESERPEVVHQAGRQLDATLQAYSASGVEGDVVEFLDDMATAWAEADVAICRAGALTVAELCAAGVPAVLVPFPHAVDDHPTSNARYLVDADAGWLISEKDLTPTRLAERLANTDRKTLQSMGERARGLACPNAALTVAEACLEVVS